MDVFFGSFLQPMNFYLCNYPFLFDAKAKTILLETDQTIQMGTAMNNAANMAIFSMMHPNAAAQVSPFVFLNVSRENLVQDTIKEITLCSRGDLKKPLKVKFHGEEAEDAGLFCQSSSLTSLNDFLILLYRWRTKRIFHVATQRLTGSQIWNVQRIRRLKCHLVCRSFV